jgi:hypothetical protein
LGKIELIKEELQKIHVPQIPFLFNLNYQKILEFLKDQLWKIEIHQTADPPTPYSLGKLREYSRELEKIDFENFKGRSQVFTNLVISLSQVRKYFQLILY